MEQSLMAVWRYDRPPYYCVGEIEEMRNYGCCLVKGYQSYYSPIKILPYDKDRIAALEELARKHSDAVLALDRQCMKDAKQLLFIDELRNVGGEMC